MPSLIADLHEYIINNYLHRSLVSRDEDIQKNAYKIVLANNKDGYSFPITLYIDNVFPQFDDFLIGAVLIKTMKNKKIILIDKLANIFSCTYPFYEFVYSNQVQSDDISNDMSVDKLKKCNLAIFIERIMESVR